MTIYPINLIVKDPICDHKGIDHICIRFDHTVYPDCTVEGQAKNCGRRLWKASSPQMCHNVSCMMNCIEELSPLRLSSLGVGALYTSPMAESKLMQERLELALQCREREGPA